MISRYTRPKMGALWKPRTRYQAWLQVELAVAEAMAGEGLVPAEAVAEIKADMESPRPMDRLLCGDVGFGKTEVALRAVFKAVLDGKQVAVLAPTTVLAEQHLQTFRRRFEGFPIEVRMLSRFVDRKAAREVLEGLTQGSVDVVIGTHRLLGPDVRFRDLGLVILDEEQRFGVGQKERFKKLRTEVDVLAMSATPIPRTLNMALSGLRDISLIETGRLKLILHSVVFSDVLKAATEMVRGNIERKGQIFSIDIWDGLPPAYADAERLKQILVKLLDNANKYTPERGSLTVKVWMSTEEPDFIRCAVSDTGGGISPEDQVHIFNKFFRANATIIKAQPGTGLGLTIAKSLVEIQGGRIWVESTPGKGSTFTFTVPIAMPGTTGMFS